jgi:hypothetical protein
VLLISRVTYLAPKHETRYTIEVHALEHVDHCRDCATRSSDLLILLSSVIGYLRYEDHGSPHRMTSAQPKRP